MKNPAIWSWIKPLSERLARSNKIPGFVKQSEKTTTTKKDTKND